MNNKTLLKKLQKIERNGVINSDQDFIELLNMVKQEVYNEDNCFTTNQKRAAKKALNFLKTIEKKGIRPVLGYCDFQEINGEKYQVFTDSYILIALKTPYELPTINDYIKKYGEGIKYPDVKKLVPNTKNGEIVKIDCNEFIKKLNAGLYENGQEIECITSSSYKVNISVKRLKTILEILGTTELECYLFGNKKPLMLLDSKTKNLAILVPLYKYD